jgi:hypothetical protein
MFSYYKIIIIKLFIKKGFEKQKIHAVGTKGVFHGLKRQEEIKGSRIKESSEK